jgi:hypothetical protein
MRRGQGGWDALSDTFLRDPIPRVFCHEDAFVVAGEDVVALVPVAVSRC